MDTREYQETQILTAAAVYADGQKKLDYNYRFVPRYKDAPDYKEELYHLQRVFTQSVRAILGVQ